MKTLKIDHIGIAVNSIENSLKFYEEVLGLKYAGEEVVSAQQVKTAFLTTGDSEIELLEATEPESPIARFIAKKGEGIQHIALQVEDIEAALRELAAQGVRLIDKTPRLGAGGKRIAFLHPADASGVLLELSEKK